MTNQPIVTLPTPARTLPLLLLQLPPQHTTSKTIAPPHQTPSFSLADKM